MFLQSCLEKLSEYFILGCKYSNQSQNNMTIDVSTQ